MTLWSLPLALLSIPGLLALATRLETRRVRTVVRMTMRARTASPERAEAVIAAELAPVLAAHGFQRR